HFNWYQVVKPDPYPPAGLTVPYVDPPPGGGPAFGGIADRLPFYWDEWTSAEPGFGSYFDLQNHSATFTLDYSDGPADPRLQPGQNMSFVTSLVGVYQDGSFDVLNNFEWSSDYNGSVGGIGVRRDALEPTGGSRG